MKSHNNLNKFFFVSGTGRSGTHLIGRSIASHPSIQGRIEDPYTFRLITKLATTQDISSPIKNTVLKKILFYRLDKVLSKSNSHILEKSHPSIWLIDDLLKNYKGSKFIGIEPTVNSMLRHKGVLTWYDKLPQNKVNRFLGITEENRHEFRNYSIEKKCALRWLSHMERLKYLQGKYPKEILKIDYDDFIENSTLWLDRISEFLDVENNFTPEHFHVESRSKWKNSLSKYQLDQIYQVKSKYDKYSNNSL